MTDILGAVDSCISLAKQLYKLVDDFREAPGNARAHLLNSQLGNMRLDLLRNLVEQTERSLDHVQRNLVATAVNGLVQDLDNAILYLEDKAPDDLVSRMQWAMWSGKGVTKLFDDIESRFSVLQSLFDLARQHPSLASLDKNHFNIVSEYPEYKYVTCALGSSYCVEADLIAPDRSNLNRARPRMNVFVESYRTTSDPEDKNYEKRYKEARTLAQFVAERLWWTRVSSNAAEVPHQTGVLPCIGYDEFRVVFLLPSNLEADFKEFSPQTLRDCIMNTVRVSLETRFSLALQLAEAVFKIHLAGLAHRSIRSNFILFLKPKKETNAGGTGAARGDDAPRPAAPFRNHDENPRPGITNRFTRVFTSKEDRPTPGKPLRRNPSMTSMRKDKANLFKRMLGKGASEGKDLDLLDKATADQAQGVSPSSRASRPLGASATTPRCGKIPPGFGSLYLTSWTSAHHTGFNHNPRSEKRSRDIYMHPALRSKTAFYMGHDIYSLGVCLVEVGMWDLFVRKESSQNAKYGHLASLADVQGSGVGLEMVKNRIEDLASRELPGAMGEGYAALVNTCLTCLDPDGPWKDVGHENYRERFRNDVLLPLRSIVAGFSSWRLETTASGTQ